MLERATEMDAHLDRLKKTLRKTTMAQRVTAAIESAEYHRTPFPYTVIDNFLPAVFYDALLAGIPPVELFESKPMGKQHLDVPFSLAPLYSQRIWRFMANELIPNVITPALVAKFRVEIDDWIRRNWPDLPPRVDRAARQRRPHHVPPPRLSHPAAPRSEVVVHHLHPLPGVARATTSRGARRCTRCATTAKRPARRRTGSTRRTARLVEDVKFVPNRAGRVPELRRGAWRLHPAGCPAGKPAAVHLPVPPGSDAGMDFEAQVDAAGGTAVALGREGAGRLLAA